MNLLRRGDNLRPKGIWHAVHLRQGQIIGRRRILNDVVTVGVNHMLDVMFGKAVTKSQNPTWYMGLISNSPSPTLLTSDQLSSHSGWSEETSYSGNRKAWNDADAASRAKGTSSVSSFTMTGAADIYGAFLCSLDTGSSPVNEVQTLTVGGTPTGGVFRLKFEDQVTGDIAYNASAGTVQTALEALSNVGAGDLVCSGAGLPGADVVITAAANLAGKRLQVIGPDGMGLTGGTPTISVVQTTPGNPGILFAEGAFADGVLSVITSDVVQLTYSLSLA